MPRRQLLLPHVAPRNRPRARPCTAGPRIPAATTSRASLAPSVRKAPRPLRPRLWNVPFLVYPPLSAVSHSCRRALGSAPRSKFGRHFRRVFASLFRRVASSLQTVSLSASLLLTNVCRQEVCSWPPSARSGITSATGASTRTKFAACAVPPCFLGRLMRRRRSRPSPLLSAACICRRVAAKHRTPSLRTDQPCTCSDVYVRHGRSAGRSVDCCHVSTARFRPWQIGFERFQASDVPELLLQGWLYPVQAVQRVEV